MEQIIIAVNSEESFKDSKFLVITNPDDSSVSAIKEFIETHNESEYEDLEMNEMTDLESILQAIEDCDFVFNVSDNTSTYLGSMKSVKVL